MTTPTNSNRKSLLVLFLTFFRIGAFTFGGGYAMIPLIHREAVEQHGWITEQDMTNMLAIAESTPGVIAVNSATFVGYRVGGIFGAALATIGVTLPSLIVICILSLFYTQFLENKWVAYAFEGIRCAVVVLMAGAIFKLSKGLRFSALPLLLAIASFIASSFLGLDTLIVIFFSGVVGLVCAITARQRANKQAKGDKS